MQELKTPQVKAESAIPRKIAILGTAQTSVFDAPYKDPSWKIWDMSANFQYGQRMDMFFEMHDPDVLKASAPAEYLAKYFPFLKNLGKGLMVGHPSKEYWPDATIYPLADILDAYGDYFTCSCAYEIALAIYLHEKDLKEGGAGVETIGLWGVDMAASGEEYSYQKPCLEYWIGLARGKGLKVIIACQSPVCRTNALYAFDNPKLSREFTERLREIGIALKEKEARAAALNIEILELRGARNAIKQLSDRWML